jgi:imidazolonepropionase-like amidohydrolase
VQARTVDEIREALRLAADYHLRLIVSGATEAHAVAGELAKAKVPVILGNSETYTSDLRGEGAGYEITAPAILNRAGVSVAFFGDGASRRAMPTGRLAGEPPLNAAWAFRNGVPENDALRMITLNAAGMFGMADRIGSIEPGKDADFLVLEGHPFDYRAVPQMVYIDGRRVHMAEGVGGRARPGPSAAASVPVMWLAAGIVLGAMLGRVRVRRAPRSNGRALTVPVDQLTP